MSDSVQSKTVVHFVPQWPDNPYHAELARNLTDCGFRVDGEDRLKGISKASRASGKLPDIIHLHAIPRFSLSIIELARLAMFWIRLLRLRSMGVRVIWTIHDISHHEALHPRVDIVFSRFLFNRVDAVIVHSAAAARAVTRHWKVRRAERIVVIPHGNYVSSYPNSISQQEARQKLRIPIGKVVILFIGMIRPYKGVPDLIRAFKEVSDHNTYLLIAGKPISEILSNEIISAIGDSCEIQYRPEHINEQEIQDYLNAADVVAFPYTKALTSGALLLAMSFGRACIAPKMGALEDTLDEKGGYLYNPSNDLGLREVLQLVINERSNLEGMGEYNRRRAELWPWNIVAQMTADTYNMCLLKS